jgi:hypothetical protein
MIFDEVTIQFILSLVVASSDFTNGKSLYKKRKLLNPSTILNFDDVTKILLWRSKLVLI